MSERGRIARAAGVVAALTVLSRVTGLARDVVVGYLFGAGAGADAFFVAYRIPNLFRRFVAEGAATAAFIPIFTGYLTVGPRSEADRAARVLGTTMGVVLAAIAILGFAFASPIAALFAPGFAGTPGKLELTGSLARLVFPYLFLVGMVAAAMGVLNSLRNFAAPAYAPIVMNVVMMITALALTPWLGVYGLAVGVLAGGVGQLLSQVPALRRLQVPLVPLWEPRHPAVARLGLLLLPTLFGSAVYQINVMVSTMFASLLPTGSVAYLWYAERLFEFPLGVFAVALSTAALPSFAALAKQDPAEFRETVSFALRAMNLIAIPAAVGLALMAEPVTSVLFWRGEFTAADALQTSLAVRFFALGLWSVAAVRVIVPAFYALEDTRTPVAAAAVAFLANFTFAAAFLGPVSGRGDSALGQLLVGASHVLGVLDLRHGGLALATSLSATVNLVLLCTLLGRRLGGFGWRDWLASAARTGVASLAMVPVVTAVTGRVEWFDPRVWVIVRLAWLLTAALAGALTFVAVVLVLGGPDVTALMRRVRARAASGG
jgi:putative peptidoglycan lipid II flippase